MGKTVLISPESMWNETSGEDGLSGKMTPSPYLKLLVETLAKNTRKERDYLGILMHFSDFPTLHGLVELVIWALNVWCDLDIKIKKRQLAVILLAVTLESAPWKLGNEGQSRFWCAVFGVSHSTVGTYAEGLLTGLAPLRLSKMTCTRVGLCGKNHSLHEYNS